jgi:hypothetical protein
MSKLLTLPEMLEAAKDSRMPGHPTWVHLMETLTSQLAADLAKHLRVKAQTARFTNILDVAELEAEFEPNEPWHHCPEWIHRCDPEGEWN